LPFEEFTRGACFAPENPLISPAMDRMINKFSNQNWLLKVIVGVMGGLAFHIKFLSSFMGRF
jgi:hypothetical protein